MLSSHRSILLDAISNRDEFVEWVCGELFGNHARRWAESAFPTHNFELAKSLEMISSVWPGTIVKGGIGVLLPDYVSRAFLFSQDGPTFLESAYVLLLGRKADLSGQETFGQTTYTVHEKEKIIRALVESDEYAREERPPLLDEDLEKIESIRLQNRRNAVTYRSAIPPAAFFDRASLPYEIGDGRASYSLVSCLPGRFGLVAGMRSFCDVSGNKFLVSHGWIIAGPKCKARAGTFRLRLALDNPRNLALNFDVCVRHGMERFLNLDFSGSIDTELLFALPADVNDFEVRLRCQENRSGEINISVLDIQRDYELKLD